VAEPQAGFASVLRGLRVAAGLTQGELADATGLSLRTVSDLERGVVTMPQRDTVRLLADGLQLAGQPRSEFEAAARGHAAVAVVVPAVRTLPRDITSFTGREPELRLLERAAAGSGVVTIHAIGGMAGVGKTAFAVHAAHQLAGQFPGGQIFLPLHGHTPGQRPVNPADGLASLLLVIGVPAGQVPAQLEARSALWRDRVAGRQLLLVLDDAARGEQVLPLLPGGGGSLVLVTSRRRLSALEEARTISLDTLPPGDAAVLLARLAARPGLGTSDPAVAEMARLCGYLPLAIGMLARQLHHHPSWTVAGRAAELASAVDRLELLATENMSVAAAFDLSYADLTPGQQRLFRRLGLHPGAETDAYAAAALDGTDLTAARQALEALHGQHLLTEPVPGRYRMHDLIREHARALANHADSAQDREHAVGRLLDYYRHASARADALHSWQSDTDSARTAGPAPAALPVLRDRDEAMAWARAERVNLLACLDQVTAAGPCPGGSGARPLSASHQGWTESSRCRPTGTSAPSQKNPP
jgi:transcriptional regulator with XRE-family HTH domain